MEAAQITQVETTTNDQPDVEKTPEPQYAPNHTIYIRNLNEKINHKKLKKMLYAMFVRYGTLLDVVAKRNIRMRGQAFVVFSDIGSATNALNDLQSFPFYGKNMIIQYAKNKSDLIAKEEGTLESNKRKREAEKLGLFNKLIPFAKNVAAPPVIKKQRQTKGKAIAGTAPLGKDALTDEFLPPNKILFIQNIPPSANDKILTQIFKQFPNFVEIRPVPTKKDIAFVEYETEIDAAAVKASLNGYRFEDGAIKVTFARK